MWCKCGNTKGYACVDDSGYDDLWVCAQCKKPTRQVFESITAMRVPRGCVAILGVQGHLDGTSLVTFATSAGKTQCMFFHPYPQKVDMPRQDDLLVDLWNRLDQTVDKIRSAEHQHEAEFNKAQGLAFAESISIVMRPFYEDATAVLRESMARWKARQAGVEHDTPGLAESIWDPASRFDGTPYSVENEARVRSGVKSAPTKTGNLIPESAVATVKQGIESKMFTITQIAASYKMTPEEVSLQLNF